MSARDNLVDEAFMSLEAGLELWDRACERPGQPSGYFREVCASTRILRLGDQELVVTITASASRSKPPPSKGGSGIPLA